MISSETACREILEEEQMLMWACGKQRRQKTRAGWRWGCGKWSGVIHFSSRLRFNITYHTDDQSPSHDMRRIQLRISTRLSAQRNKIRKSFDGIGFSMSKWVVQWRHSNRLPAERPCTLYTADRHSAWNMSSSSHHDRRKIGRAYVVKSIYTHTGISWVESEHLYPTSSNWSSHNGAGRCCRNLLFQQCQCWNRNVFNWDGIDP